MIRFTLLDTTLPPFPLFTTGRYIMGGIGVYYNRQKGVK